MSTTLFVTYRLQDGADLEAFAAWAAEVDAPRCREYEACLSFETYVVPGAAPQDPQVIEVIEVTSLDAWNATIASPEHADVMATWDTFGLESSVRLLEVRPV